MDAISLLKQDHRRIEALFKQFETATEAKDARAQTGIGHQICDELYVHATIEELHLYPAAKRRAKNAEDEINEGIVEHMGIKRLVKELKSMTASDELFKAKATCLIEYVKHHVKEEEAEMFPKIEKSGLDLEAVGEQLAAARARLQKRVAAAPRRANGAARPRGSRSNRSHAAAQH